MSQSKSSYPLADPTPSTNVSALRGAAALMHALDQIGREDSTDHVLAKIIVDAELDIRQVVRLVLENIE